MQKTKNSLLVWKYGEMSELAEGARLEIACTTKSGTGGSNPPLSATYIKKFNHGIRNFCNKMEASTI